MNEIELYSLPSELIPKDVMYYMFPSLGRFPISGGWGYNEEDAVVIEKPGDGLPFDGVAFEYTFSQYRTYLELITFREIDDRYSGIQFSTKRQELISGENGKMYDRLLIEISALRDKDFNMLKQAWENNLENPDFDRGSLFKQYKALQIVYIREFWFEISSFYYDYDKPHIDTELFMAKIQKEIDNQSNAKKKNRFLFWLLLLGLLGLSYLIFSFYTDA